MTREKSWSLLAGRWMVAMVLGCGGGGTVGPTLDAVDVGRDRDALAGDRPGPDRLEVFEATAEEGRHFEVPDAEVPREPGPEVEMSDGDLLDAEAPFEEAGPATCESAKDCPGESGCRDGACVVCQVNADCAGKGVCRDGGCKPCRSAFECDEGLGCLQDGTCGPCGAGKDCGGRLCEDGFCVPCEPGVDDEACREQFGPDYEALYGPESVAGIICRPQGICSNTCISGTDCFWVQMVCGPDHYCIPCQDDTFCLSQATGGYPQGTKCVAGQCIQEACLSHKSCPPSAPVCDKTCRPCVTNEECAQVIAVLGRGSGGICTEAQACVPGDCGGLFQVKCSGAKICDSYVCRPCAGPAEDGLCQAQYGGQYICEAAACVKGCIPGTFDADGRICGDDMRFHDCISDEQCAAAYSNPAYICDPVSLGGPMRCKKGCTPPDHNALGQVCGQDHRFRDCAADGECKDAYGDFYKICEPQGQGFICKDGKAPGTACFHEEKAVQGVVGPDNRCHLCSELGATTMARDGQCKNAYGPLYICEGDACTLGCQPGSKCPDGRLCKADNRCYPCVDVQDDSTCGIGFLCIQGVCTPGICREDWFCQTYYDGKVCKDHFCKPCDPETTCPGGFVCAAGKCVEGNCCVDANCEPVVSCEGDAKCFNYHCEGCVYGTDCYPQWPCLVKAGACNPDHTCKPAETLDVNFGYCFINNACWRIGDMSPDHYCLVCYWRANAEGQVIVGSKKEWTPGTYNATTGKFSATHCFIEDKCIPGQTIKEDVPGLENSQSARCWWCDPRAEDWDSLHHWSVRPDTNNSFDPHVNWTKRIPCDDPLYTVPDPNNPFSTKDSRIPAYSGTSQGYCWQGACRGIAWTPWLPIGFAGAGFIVPAPIGGMPLHLVGSFGGGFGSGIPNPNPGCSDGKDCQVCPYLGGCP